MPRTTVVALRLTDEQLARLDQARGDVSRADYLRGIIDSPVHITATATTTAASPAKVLVNGQLVIGGPAEPHPSTSTSTHSLRLLRTEVEPRPKNPKGKR